MTTQNDQVLARLRLNGDGGLSGLEALRDLGVYRLAARIHELRMAGYLIVNHPERGHARYVLVETGQLGMEQIVGYQ